MQDQVIPILLGFVLTTLIGGLFASYLQQRSWQHQKASEVCESFSALLDKRWYRMDRLLSAIWRYSEGRPIVGTLESRLAAYDEVLLEWNDQLNGRLATIGAYFGGDVRYFVDDFAYKAFKDAGAELEELYRRAVSGERLDADALKSAKSKVKALNSVVYDLSEVLMIRLRAGRVGRSAPGVPGEPRVRKILRKYKSRSR
jgi:hypothetical protein